MLCPENATALEGLRGMEAPKGTEAGWKEFAGGERLEAESPYLRDSKGVFYDRKIR